MNKKNQKQYRFYQSLEFDDEQLDEIKKGIDDGLDVSVYARSNMPASEMAHIRKSMNFKRSLNAVVNPQDDKDTSNIEEEINAKTKEEKLTDVAIGIGEVSIVAAVIAALLAILRII